ncbi:putative PX domain-containing protein [Hamiltosporidium magnivora]|uniref:Putative PX domain-containing protein n=1 Tax=Hamiltosporidium magnivora TaxID=148818 RepID=A0A4Q9LAX1_9MICR|nr:putative PX domain-containing protein [Hamiltosporidium magnivora]
MTNSDIFEISIQKHIYLPEKNCTVYEIVCITNSDHFKKCHSRVLRRYSEFRALHYKMKKDIPALPQFPSKCLNRLNYNVVQERHYMLNAYIKYLGELFFEKKNFNEKWAKCFVEFITNSEYKIK